MNAKVEQAKLSRMAVLQEKLSKGGSVLSDAPPPTLLAQTLPGGDLRIPVDKLQAPLQYIVPKPVDEYEDDLLQPQVRKKGAPDWQEVLPDEPYYIELGPVDDRDWDVPFDIPLSFMIEDPTPEAPTEYEFRYILWAGGTNQSISVPVVTYAIDRTPPYKIKSTGSDRKPGAPTWPADLGPNDPIDEAYLEGKAGIPVKHAVSPTYHPSDIYRFYWGPAPDENRDTPVFDGVLTAGEALIPAAVFKENEGKNLLVYIATDLPGNEGKKSNSSERNVVILPDPGVILPPVIPLANGPSGDGLIDLADTQFDSKGVEIKVTVPTPNSISDTIVVYWGGKSITPEQRVGTNTELSFFASYDLVKEKYGDTDGSVDTEVSYKMFRSNRQIATDKANIDVDVSFVGPDPILVGLDAPKLETSAGSIDEILESDYGDTGIKITIDLFAIPPTEEGWLIDVLYDDVKIGETIALTTGQEGTTLTIPLPWATVLAQQSGTKVLSYKLYTRTGANPTPSRNKSIDVEAFPIEMVAPEVLYLGGPLRRISCPTLNFPVTGNPGDGTPRRNLTVRVRKNQYTVDGETITVKWVPYDNAVPPAPIPGADTTATYLITGTYPDPGALIEIGVYATHFKPAHLGKGRVTYSISRGAGTPTPDSLPAEHVVFLTDNQGKYCEETLPQV